MNLLLESFVKEKVHFDVNTCEKVLKSFKEGNEVVRFLIGPKDVAKGSGEICYRMCIVVFIFLAHVVFML